MEKILSGIIGFVVGDALGVPVEFLDRKYLEKHPLTEMIGYGSHNVPDGTWSDDTSMLLATIDSIIETHTIDYNDIMYKFSEWFDYSKYTATGKLFDIGISTRKAISNFKSGKNVLDCGCKGFNENGNGSLMRILPLVYYLNLNDFSEEEEVEIVNNVSSITHAHEVSCLGCKIFSDYVNQLLNGCDKYQALDYIKNKDYIKYYSKNSVELYNRILKGNLINLENIEIKSSGFVVHSLEASLWCTLNNDSYEDAVMCAVNLGEDTDTIGAITGSINGILYGFDSIPKKWLNKIRNGQYLFDLTNEFIDVINKKKLSK